MRAQDIDLNIVFIPKTDSYRFLGMYVSFCKQLFWFSLMLSVRKAFLYYHLLEVRYMLWTKLSEDTISFWNAQVVLHGAAVSWENHNCADLSFSQRMAMMVERGLTC